MTNGVIKNHKLYGYQEKSLPRHILFFDTETNQKRGKGGEINHTFRLGYSCYWRPDLKGNSEITRYDYLATIEDFWKILDSVRYPKSKIWLIAHNIGFDFVILKLFSYFQSRGFKRKLFYDKGITTLLSFSDKSTTFVLMSSTNHFPFVLKILGERIGINKLEVDFKRVKEAELKVYCKRDVEILVKTYQEYFDFLAHYDLGAFKPTNASQALSAYRYRFMDFPIFIHADKTISDRERQGYYGGRSEAFFIGKLNNPPYYMLDVNSLYPSVMIGENFPTEYKGKCTNPTIDQLFRLSRDNLVVANCDIKTPVNFYPLKKDKLLFPIGQFNTTLNTPEIRFALLSKHIVKCHWCLCYSGEQIFKRYIEEIYHLRKQAKDNGDDFYSLLLKNLMNCLYGKFGQQAEIWEKIGDCSEEIYELYRAGVYGSKETWTERKLFGVHEKLSGYKDSYNTFVAIASHVTSYARCKVYSYFERAGFENVFYTDTDSLLVNQIGFDRLQGVIDKSKLGLLSIKGKFTDVEIFGVKDYKLDGAITLKGVPKSAIKNADGSYSYEQWQGFRQQFKEGSTGIFTVKPIRKELKRLYDKGTINDLCKVNPLILFG